MKYQHSDSRLENDFIVAYIDALIWSESDDDGEPLDRDYDSSDLSSEALEEIKKDCLSFLEKAYDLIQEAECKRNSGQYSKEEQAGHDFCLTRNGHGAGFWDGDWYDPENEDRNIGDELTELCKAYRERNLYVGDDGKLYIL